MKTEYRCCSCQKTLSGGNLPLLSQKKYTPAGETPRIEHRRPRCETLNAFAHDQVRYVSK